MFREFYEMWSFISYAPYFIIGAFLTTFTFVKIIQSETLYQIVTDQIDQWRAKKARLIRQQMFEEIALFLRGRDESKLSPIEQKIYGALLESYASRARRLYGEESRK